MEIEQRSDPSREELGREQTRASSVDAYECSSLHEEGVESGLT